MGRGTRLQAGGQDTHVVEFHMGTGADTVSSVTTTAETSLNTVFSQGGDVAYWTAPWPCRVAEVYCEANFTASGDAANFRVRRNDIAAVTTADDIIRNAVGGSATDAVRVTAAAAATATVVRYTGELQDTSVSPSLTGIASTETASGFFDGETVLAAGDRLTATYAMQATLDAMSHVRCKVTVAKIEAS